MARKYDLTPSVLLILLPIILFFIASLTTGCGLIGGEGEDGEKERPLLDGVKNRVGNVKKRFQDAKKRGGIQNCLLRDLPIRRCSRRNIFSAKAY